MQGLTRQVPIANDIKQRAVKIVFATRSNKEIIQYGASPRASIGLILASKARALVQGRNHVSNDDLNMLAYPILRHRIILNFEAERKGMSVDDAIKNVLDKTKYPLMIEQFMALGLPKDSALTKPYPYPLFRLSRPSLSYLGQCRSNFELNLADRS